MSPDESALWVTNASPLIALARVGQLDLLFGPGRALLVPEDVAREVLAGPPGDAARTALEGGFGGTPVPSPLDPAVLEWGLGAGESSVLALARTRGGVALLDDRDARRAARAFGVPVLGTLGVVLRAKRSGSIPSAAEVLRLLRRAGFRLDDGLVSEALARATGETWEP